VIKKLLYIISLLLLLFFSCTKVDIQAPNTSESLKTVIDVAEEEGLLLIDVSAGVIIGGGTAGWISLSLTKPSRFFKYQSVQDRPRLATLLPPGTEVTISAAPADGYYFDNWSNGWTANPITFKLNSETIVTAVFKTIGD
jgi:hypothetical protein